MTSYYRHVKNLRRFQHGNMTSAYFPSFLLNPGQLAGGQLAGRQLAGGQLAGGTIGR